MNALGVVENPEDLDAFFGDQGILVHRSPDLFVFECLMEAFDAADGFRMITLADDVFPEAPGSHCWSVVGQELDLLRYRKL